MVEGNAELAAASLRQLRNIQEMSEIENEIRSGFQKFITAICEKLLNSRSSIPPINFYRHRFWTIINFTPKRCNIEKKNFESSARTSFTPILMS
jgi:hypothetical protein